MYLISACLCGVNCKYNGLNNYNNKLENLFIEGKAILVCPEQLGGLNTPRIPSELLNSAEEIVLGLGRVITKDGSEVTEEFIRGAKEVANIISKINIDLAIFKDGSPSCGVNYVYDGTFSNRKIKGMGITTKMLKDLGIKVISDNDFGGE